jgi:hypothetical protein
MLQGDSYLYLEPKVLTTAYSLIVVLVGLLSFVSRWAKNSLRVAIAVVWASGIFLAVGGGTVPGLTAEPFSYPTRAVMGVVGLISVESLLLYAILGTQSQAGSLRRFVLAEVLFLTLLMVFGGVPTDHPGYSYAHERFLLLVNFALVLRIVGVFGGRSHRLAKHRAA